MAPSASIIPKMNQAAGIMPALVDATTAEPPCLNPPGNSGRAVLNIAPAPMACLINPARYLTAAFNRSAANIRTRRNPCPSLPHLEQRNRGAPFRDLY